jgi:hypothetical protein
MFVDLFTACFHGLPNLVTLDKTEHSECEVWNLSTAYSGFIYHEQK